MDLQISPEPTPEEREAILLQEDLHDDVASFVYDRLRRALADGARWYDVDTADGPIALDLGQIVFLRLDNAEHRVGFSGL